MRRLPFLCVLLAASTGLRADPAETPFLVFREPDPATRKRMERDLITEKQLGGQVPDGRRRAREELAAIPWSPPFLATALRKESSARIRLNAVLTLAMIRDPRGLPALREAAKDDRAISVRRAATLAIALFEWPSDLETLKGLLATPDAEWRSAAPALARLHAKGAASILKMAAERLPRDEHDAAAIVLSAAIAGADVPLSPLLEDKAKLVQEAAAAGLAIRPLPPQRAGEILAALKRSRMSSPARVLAIRALGAIAPRPAEAEEKLLDLACGDGPADERIAALLQLEGSADEFGPLWKAYRKLEGRNDPVLAALLLAMARTREGKAKDTLVGLLKHDFLGLYAGAALLDVYGPGKLDEDLRARIVQVEKLAELAQDLAKDSEAVRQAAHGKLRYVDDPRNLKLYFPREARNWLEVNRLLTRIFELDKVLNQFDSARPGRTPESALGGGSGGEDTRKAPSGTDEEQDLFDLLIPPNPDRRPYFGPGDLGGG